MKQEQQKRRSEKMSNLFGWNNFTRLTNYNKLFMVSICLLIGTLVNAKPLQLNSWSRVTSTGTIEIINLKTYSRDNFSLRTQKTDDRVVIDFMDYQNHNTIKVIDKQKTIQLTGDIAPTAKAGSCSFSGQARVDSPNKITYSISAHVMKGKPMESPWFSIRFNQAILDRTLTFQIRNASNKIYNHYLTVTSEHKAGWVWSSHENVQSIELPMMHGVLSLSGFSAPVMVCKYGKGVGNIRIYLSKKGVTRIKGNLNIEFKPYKSTCLNLKPVANMGFADEKANDQKGGWTDQGSRNDMRKLTTGIQKFGNIDFDVVDPNKNNGKSVLALAGKERSYFLKNAKIDGNGNIFDYLYLLNATSWGRRNESVGTISVNYEDGSKSDFNVKEGRDIGGWWAPNEAFSNCTPVWKNKNPSHEIGLHLSRYKLKPKKINSITFTTANNAVWLIVGATGVSGRPPFPHFSEMEVPLAIETGKDWKAFNIDLAIAKGSALDFSGNLDAPAGKYGRLEIKGSQFVFSQRPDCPIRFLGINLYGDLCFLSHADSDILADHIAARGYNIARILSESSIKKGTREIEFDPERLDRFFYFISALKKKGIYITTMLYANRIDGFSRKFNGMFDVKSRILFDESLRKNILEYGDKLLCTVNPYTGMPLKDDPVLATLELINEDPAFTTHGQYKYPNKDPERNAMFKALLKPWCAKNGLNPNNITKEIWTRFLVDRHIKVYEEMKSYLRKSGVKAPITDMSCSSTLIGQIPRSKYDYVDNHFYISHPRFLGKAWKMPQFCKKTQALKDCFPILLRVSSTRIIGKPFTVSEFNYCSPNMFRSEAGPAVSSVAALQNWNGLFYFGVAYRFKYKEYGLEPFSNFGHLGSFSPLRDPIKALGNYIISMFYLRRDVKTASGTSILDIPSDAWKLPESAGFMEWGTKDKAEIPACFSKLGLYQKIGTRIGNKNNTDNGYSLISLLKKPQIDFHATSPGVFDLKKGIIVSSTGQIFTDTKAGTMKVITPKSEALVVSGKNLSGKILKVADNTTFATVFAGSLDDLPLFKSRRILVLHLTDVKASGQKLAIFKDQLRIYNYGKFKPYLVRRGSAKISLSLSKGTYCVKALDVNGAEIKEINAVKNNNELTFKVATDCGPEGKAVFAYEISKSGHTNRSQMPDKISGRLVRLSASQSKLR